MSGKLVKGVIAGAALASTPVSAQAVQQQPDRVAVAIVDISADKIDTVDANVRFVNLTPAPPEGRTFAKSRQEQADHGDYVASAFVREFRRMDARTPIDIYSVNPFMQKNAHMIFSRKVVTDAIPVLKQNGVKVVITAFGIENKEAGDAIVDQFRKAGMVVFAAIPNAPGDVGIYPAANRNTISVGDNNGTRGALAHRKDWATWVDFAMDGNQQGMNGQWAGSSFAVGKAAAYGVMLTRVNPEMSTEDVRHCMGKYADPSRYGQVKVAGTNAMVGVFSNPEILGHLAALKAPSPDTAPTRAPAHSMAAAARIQSPGM